MPYAKTNWSDLITQFPEKYNLVNNVDGSVNIRPYHLNFPATVIQNGTPVNALNLQKMEDQLETLTEQVENGATFLSTGVVGSVSYTDLGNGSITIPTTTVNFYTNATYSGNIVQVTVPEKTISLVDQSPNAVLARWNAGSPEFFSTTNLLTATGSDIVPVFTIYRDGNELYSIEWGGVADGLVEKLALQDVRTKRFSRESGLIITEFTNVPPFRRINVSGGAVWYAGKRNALNGNTTDSPVNRTRLFFQTAPNVFTSQTITQLNNSQFSTDAGLVALGAGRYAVNWVYRDLSTNRNEVYILLGNGNFTLAEAQASQPPAALPPLISRNAILVGRVLYQNGANTATSIQSAFDVTFAGANISDHGSLANLQGGTGGEYFHLTANEYTGNVKSGINAEKVDGIHLQVSSGSLQFSTDNVNFTAAGSSIPSGSVQMYAGSSAPSGWLICNGVSVPTATYPALFTAIGYTYGGSGVSFNLPNMTDRSPLGASGSRPLGSQGGNSAADLSHSHTYSTTTSSAGAHTHAINLTSGSSASQFNTSFQAGTTSLSGNTNSHTHPVTGNTLTSGDHSHTASGTTFSALGNTSLYHPYLSLNFIIKI